MSLFDGQAVIIFGASSGMGKATALAFAHAGAKVTIVARNEKALAEVSGQIEGDGGQVLAVAGDVSNRALVDSVVNRSIERWGQINTVVNCAGLNVQERRMDVLKPESWEHVLKVNLTGAFNTTQSILAHFRSRGGGLIVQVSSVSGRYGDLSGASYQASKHGMIGLCQSTMFEERQNGIRVSAIMPGLVDTPMPMRRPVPPPRSLLDQAIQPDDIAQACLFLASLPARTYVPEMILLPSALQCIGQTAI